MLNGLSSSPFEQGDQQSTFNINYDGVRLFNPHVRGQRTEDFVLSSFNYVYPKNLSHVDYHHVFPKNVNYCSQSPVKEIEIQLSYAAECSVNINS